MAEAVAKGGRSIDDVELVAISKTHDAEKVRVAFDAGQRLFGESGFRKPESRFRCCRPVRAGILWGVCNGTRFVTRFRSSSFSTASIRWSWLAT